MILHDFSAVPAKEIAPGVRGRYVHSGQVTQGLVDLAQGAVVPDHSHPHEQWTMVMVDGKVLYIAPNERHSARAVIACQVLDVFHPVREDYR